MFSRKKIGALSISLDARCGDHDVQHSGAISCQRLRQVPPRLPSAITKREWRTGGELDCILLDKRRFFGWAYIRRPLGRRTEPSLLTGRHERIKYPYTFKRRSKRGAAAETRCGAACQAERVLPFDNR